MKICHWILLAITGLLVSGRLYARIFVRTNAPKGGYLGDAFVVTAWLTFFSLAVTMQLLYNSDFFNPLEDYFENATSYQLRLGYVNDVMMWPCLYFVKFAMLCFFDGVVTKELFIKTWVSIRVIAVISAIAFVYSWGTTVFWCWPVSLNWDLESDCMTRSDIQINRSTWGLHMATDVLVYSLGFCLLSEMRNLPLREKFGAGCMFALGFVGMAVSAIAYWVPGTYFSAYVYRGLEQATLITITCIPSLRILFSRVWGRRKSEYASGGSSGRGTGGSGSGGSAKTPGSGRSTRVTGMGELDLTLTAEEEADLEAGAGGNKFYKKRHSSTASSISGWEVGKRKGSSIYHERALRTLSEASSETRVSGRTLMACEETPEEDEFSEDYVTHLEDSR